MRRAVGITGLGKFRLREASAAFEEVWHIFVDSLTRPSRVGKR